MISSKLVVGVDAAFVASERDRAPNAMERQLVQEAEDSVYEKGNEVGFGCYRSAQPLPR